MISIKEVEHVAKLARLSLNDEEKLLYTQQLAAILAYFDELKQVDTAGVEPLAHSLAIDSVMRADEVIPPPGAELLLSGAPCRQGSYFRVPKIAE